MVYRGDYLTYERACQSKAAMANGRTESLDLFVPAFCDFHLQMEWAQVTIFYHLCYSPMHLHLCNMKICWQKIVHAKDDLLANTCFVKLRFHTLWKKTTEKLEWKTENRHRKEKMHSLIVLYCQCMNRICLNSFKYLSLEKPAVSWWMIMAAMAMLQVMRCNVTCKLSCHPHTCPVCLFSPSESGLFQRQAPTPHNKSHVPVYNSTLFAFTMYSNT